MTLILRKIGDEIVLYDGSDRVTSFAGKTVDEVKDWISVNVKNVQVIC